MAFVPKIPSIPRIKLPPLALNLIKPLSILTALSAAARAKIVCALITSVFSPLQKLYSGLSGLSGDGIKNALISVRDKVAGQIEGVVSSALATATGAVKSLLSVPNDIINSFKTAGDTLKKQKENIKSLISDEIDCISSSFNSSFNVSKVQSSISKQTLKRVSNLNNNEQKKLLEDPVKKQEYVEKITDDVVDDSSKSLSSSLASNYTQQVVAVDKLETLAPAETPTYILAYGTTSRKVIVKLTRLQRLELLKDDLNNVKFEARRGTTYFVNRLSAMEKEITFLESSKEIYPDLPST